MRILPFIYVLFCLFSCKKEPIQIDLTNHNEKRIIGQGYFTNIDKPVTFQFYHSTNLGDTTTDFVDEVVLSIKTPDGPINFDRTAPGTFTSTVPFGGIPDVEYTIQFFYKSVAHEVKTIMPKAIDLDSVQLSFFDTLGIYPTSPYRIWFHTNSPKTQNAIVKIFKADTTYFPVDTIWNEYPIPVYQMVEFNGGESIITEVEVSHYPTFGVVKGDLVKFELYTLSNDVAIYLEKLEQYLESEVANSQFYNPPSYYSNNGYGLGFGTCIDSFLIQY